ncbi:DNA mismatch repair protein [Mycobacterium intermedium]|uniref:DNA mismatch repair protein n=1 Tax=Mycobacterium intermedium TaxID=28445 RepID=A0A1E3SJF6_MYCIE|nr:DNA mismatch repair protein [Mycobacterium intermedium]MCV6963767.1 DNA mismatch repair protein [Mycobacterium intermedium]ODR02249.1 DNA mismatch repair protein [Mycobacterium intermedium]OPE48379.1 DNA mismatch repair protein [Mycobacterium intermedium]ORA97602.1 DNA mismatch repair protein [Mycobacterium intermedium]
MKVRLLHPNDDVELKPQLPEELSDLVNDDLELDRLYEAMGAGDRYLREAGKKVLPLTVSDPDVIIYRQHVLGDCLANRAVVRRIYAMTSEVEGIALRHKVFLGGLRSNDAQLMLRRSVRILELLLKTLRLLRRLASDHADRFRSAGFRQFFAMLTDQLSDDYLSQVDEYLSELQLPRGLLLSAQLGMGNKGEGHLLHQPTQRGRGWWAKLAANPTESREFSIDPDDMAGEQALSALGGHAVNDVANTVTQAAEHFQSFFGRLRTELGFYLGCLNLRDELTRRHVPICFPEPIPVGAPRFRCRGLRDVALCLSIGKMVTGNDVEADGKTLIVVTGANEGGKSTFLRSVGAAQLMMQAGMFVAAEAFSANVRGRVFTHFKREEDANLRHGKLEEELGRLSQIVDHIEPTSLLLCNESFSSTNELEGSQIARGIVRAMVEGGVKVFFVTHLYDFAHSLYARDDPADLFLRAERRSDGVRTFRLVPGEPESTSYGQDSFRRIFGVAAQLKLCSDQPLVDTES